MAPSPRRPGTALKRTGAVLLITGSLIGIVVSFVQEGGVVVLAISVLTSLMIVTGAFFFWRGRQVPKADEGRLT